MRRRPRAARRQGHRACRDDAARGARAGGLHDHDRRLPRVHARGRAARRPRRRDRRAHRPARAEDGQALRRPRRPAARLGALRRRRLDARDDGHDPEPRPERPRRRRRAGALHRQHALCARLLPAAHPDVRRGRRRRRRAPLRAGAHRSQARPRRAAGRRSHGRRPRAARRDVQGDLPPGDRRRLPAGCARAAPARGARGVPVVAEPARAGVPPHVRDPGRHRHRGERRADGVRQQGRPLRDRRLLHARPVHGRDRPLRRVPRERPGRGRRGRHSHTAAGRGDAGAAPRGLRPAPRDHAPARAALPRHPGHRVHDRGRDALPSPDALGEAHRRRGSARSRRHDERGPDLARGSGRTHRSRAARPAPAPDDRPGRRTSRSPRAG